MLKYKGKHRCGGHVTSVSRLFSPLLSFLKKRFSGKHTRTRGLHMSARTVQGKGGIERRRVGGNGDQWKKNTRHNSCRGLARFASVPHTIFLFICTEIFRTLLEISRHVASHLFGVVSPDSNTKREKNTNPSSSSSSFRC